MKPWILLVGTSFSAAPLLQALRGMGFAVAVCGALPDDPCVAMADAYHQLDYSDREALLALVRREGYRYLCPSCNDYAYLAACYVADQLGLPGYDAPAHTAILHDKAAFRAHAQTIGLQVPRACAADDSTGLQALRLPLLVKPTDSFSGRGMQRVTQRAQLADAIARARQASRSGSVVVEEFIDGSLHSHSAFIQDGRILQDVFVDEFCQVYPYQVDCSNAPSRLDETVRERMRQQILQLVASLQLCDGLLHTQFIDHHGQPYLIEPMRRCPGDLYYHLVQLATAMPYVDNYVAPFAGRAMQAGGRDCAQYWARHTVSFARDSVFYSLSPRVPQALDLRLYPLADSASTIKAAPYGKAAIVFARLPDAATLFELAPRLGSLFAANLPERHHD